jgi:exosome complex RNA-binding protein Rrp42 (RNase PH superfamily)
MYPSWSTGVCILLLNLMTLYIPSLTLFQVWHIRLTLHFLADAGNLLDCACLAGIVALKHFRRPDVEVVGDEVTVVCIILLHCLMYPTSNIHISFSISPLNAPQYPSLSIIHHFASLSHSSLMRQRLRLSILLNLNND